MVVMRQEEKKNHLKSGTVDMTTAAAEQAQDGKHPTMAINVPIEEITKIIDNAIMNGYTVAWGGDVSEDGFTRDGLAYMYDTKKLESMEGSDMARWLKLSKAEKKNIVDSLGVNASGITFLIRCTLRANKSRS